MRAVVESFGMAGWLMVGCWLLATMYTKYNPRESVTPQGAGLHERPMVVLRGTLGKVVSVTMID